MRLLHLFAAFVLPIILSISAIIWAVCSWLAWAERSRTSRTQHVTAVIGLTALMGCMVVVLTVWAQLLR